MDNTVVRDLIDAGIHFGHRAGRWNPKMKPYIFCARNSIHIIDIKETVRGLIRARKFVTSVVSSGKDVLFVGTKRQARSAVSHHAEQAGMPFVSERWLGGTLTNFRTIRARLTRLEELERMEEQGLLASESKKMESTLRRELRKIRRNLGGIRTMDKLPGAMVVIDARREVNAIMEARKLGIPTVALLDTDSDPDLVDLPIPGNDDAMRAIEVIMGQLTEAVAEGKAARPTMAEGATAVERPRSRRVTTAQAAEAISGGQPVPVPGGVPQGEPAKPDAATEPSAGRAGGHAEGEHGPSGEHGPVQGEEKPEPSSQQ